MMLIVVGTLVTWTAQRRSLLMLAMPVMVVISRLDVSVAREVHNPKP